MHFQQTEIAQLNGFSVQPSLHASNHLTRSINQTAQLLCKLKIITKESRITPFHPF
jgi:hypothetical protein